MTITGLSHLFKWENLHNWWLTKYFFAPLYVFYVYVAPLQLLCCALMHWSWYIVLCGSSGSERIVCSLFTPVKLSVGVWRMVWIYKHEWSCQQKEDTVEMSGFGVNVFVGHGILHTYNKAVYKTSMQSLYLLTRVVSNLCDLLYFVNQ